VALPCGEFRLVGRLADVASGVVGEVADGAHRQGLPRAFDLQLDHDLRTEGFVQFVPGGGAGELQLRGKRFFSGRHQMPRLDGDPLQGVGVCLGDGRGGDEGCDVQAAQPGGEPRCQHREAQHLLFQATCLSLRQLVARVRRGEGVDVGVEGAQLVAQGVVALQDRLEEGDRLGVDGQRRVAQQDGVGVEGLRERVERCNASLKAGLEFRRVQAGENRRHVPMG